MDKLSLEKKTSVLNKLEEVAKCPICLNLLRPPLWYCVNGHCICMECKGSLTICPTCRGSGLQREKILILDEMLNSLPRPCKFDGCDVFEPEPDLKLHESGCRFRKVACRLAHCSWEDKANSLPDHLKNVHSDHITFEKEESNVVFNHFKLYKNTLNVGYANAYDCIFWFYAKTDPAKGIHMICFVCVPTASGVVNDFYSTMMFSSKKNPDIKFQHTQKVYNEDVDIDSVFSPERCFTIPLSETKHFIDKEGNLCWSYKIFRDS